MDHVALSAALNGDAACRCNDTAAALRASMEGKPGPRETCPSHSDTGRAARVADAELRARLAALDALETRYQTETQAVALNSPTLADSVRAAFASTPTNHRLTRNPPPWQ
jgi:hypothetical protein